MKVFDWYFGCFIVVFFGCYFHYLAADEGGGKWTATQLPIDDGLNRIGKHLAINYDGSKIAIASKHGGIYASEDGGKTFLRTDAPISDWRSLISDGSGNHMYALDGNAVIWSSSYGKLLSGWDLLHKTRLRQSYNYFYDITVNSDAQYLYGITGTCYMYRFQYRMFDLITSIPQFANIVCNKIITDHSGQHVIVQGIHGTASRIAVSNDYGVSFTTYDLPYNTDKMDDNNVFMNYNSISMVTSNLNNNKYVFITTLYNNTNTLLLSSSNDGMTFTSTKYWFPRRIAESIDEDIIALTCSGNGQYVLYGSIIPNTANSESIASCSNQLKLWLSNDYGETFSLILSICEDSLSMITMNTLADSIHIFTKTGRLYSYHGSIGSLKSQPTTTFVEAPVIPVHRIPSMEGWITRSQYLDRICDSKVVPPLITGFRTGECFPVSKVSAMYTFDGETIVMTVFHDADCQHAVAQQHRFTNGQHLFDAAGQCEMTIQFTPGTTVENALPRDTLYGTLQYSSNPLACQQITSFQAMQSMVCIPTIYKTSIMMEYPFLYEFTTSMDCTGPFVENNLDDGQCSTSPTIPNSGRYPQTLSDHKHWVQEDRHFVLEVAALRHELRLTGVVEESDRRIRQSSEAPARRSLIGGYDDYFPEAVGSSYADYVYRDHWEIANDENDDYFYDDLVYDDDLRNHDDDHDDATADDDNFNYVNMEDFDDDTIQTAALRQIFFDSSSISDIRPRKLVSMSLLVMHRSPAQDQDVMNVLNLFQSKVEMFVDNVKTCLRDLVRCIF